jgi:hypothetical protein
VVESKRCGGRVAVIYSRSAELGGQNWSAGGGIELEIRDDSEDGRVFTKGFSPRVLDAITLEKCGEIEDIPKPGETLGQQTTSTELPSQLQKFRKNCK